MFHVYVLHSQRLDRHYVGQTGNIGERLRFHLEKSTPFTAQADDWRLIFLERVASRKDAMALEKRIKQAKSRLAMARYISDERNLIEMAMPIAEALALTEAAKPPLTRPRRP